MNFDYSLKAKKYTMIAAICAVLFFVLKPVIFAFIPFDYTITATIIYAIVGYLPAFILGDIALFINIGLYGFISPVIAKYIPDYPESIDDFFTRDYKIRLILIGLGVCVICGSIIRALGNV